MKKFSYIYIPLIVFITVGLGVSCTKESETDIIDAENTVFMYFPWSTDLINDFYRNIKDMETNICQSGGLANDRVIVFISTSPEYATMYEIVYNGSTCSHVPIKSYTDYPFTTEQGLTQLLKEVREYAPAKNYSMIIGCHGMGWLPVNESRKLTPVKKYHYDYGDGVLRTRYFGGKTKNFQTDISTLADALRNTGLKMEYILFDDCYMASIEVAYELKDVTNHLIASTCEIMAYGMPYATMGKYLLGKPNYKAICDEFYKFYSNYTIMPCGTISVTDCSQLEELAGLMKYINSSYKFDETIIEHVQKLDGYSPTIFFDYGDYVKKLLEYNNADEELIETFFRQLSLTVPFKTHTERFFTANYGSRPINTYSGITTSDPSINPGTKDKVYTKWYYATH